jgi:hypothetical protein
VHGKRSRSPLRSDTVRNIKVSPALCHIVKHYRGHYQLLLNNETRFAEVHFFIHLDHKDCKMALALVSMYSPPDPMLLRLSMHTLWSCEYLGDNALKFVDVTAIQSVVAMIPHSPSIDGRPPEEHFFLVEKPGFDIAIVSGIEEEIPDDENGMAAVQM